MVDISSNGFVECNSIMISSNQNCRNPEMDLLLYKRLPYDLTKFEFAGKFVLPNAFEDGNTITKHDLTYKNSFFVLIPNSVQTLKEFFAKKPKIIVGRKTTCDYILPFQLVSREHALFVFENNKLFIEDLESSCGTFLKIDKFDISNGESIILKLGANQFKIELNKVLKVNAVEGPLLNKCWEFPFEPSQISIGRKDDCQICLIDDKLISKIHCEIVISDGKISILDKKSSNGTWLRLKAKKRVQISNKSNILIGEIVLNAIINNL